MERNKCETCGWFKEYHSPIKENYVGEGDCSRYPNPVRKLNNSCCGEYTDSRWCKHDFKDLYQLTSFSRSTCGGYSYEVVGKKCLVCGFEVWLDEKE